MFHFLFQFFHSWIKLFCAAAHPVTMQFDIITSNEAKYISLTAYLFQTSPSHKIYCYRSHSKIKWEWILSLSVIKELRSAYGNWGVEALVEANWHRKTDTERQGNESSLCFCTYVDSNCPRYLISASTYYTYMYILCWMS